MIHDTTEKIIVIQERIKATNNRQEAYANLKKRKGLNFQIGDYVWLKVSPMKGLVRFGKRGKLAPRYIGPFQVIAKIGNMAYKLDLPLELRHIHDTFYVSIQKKYLSKIRQVISATSVPVAPNFTYEKQPMKILAKDTTKVRSKWISMVKIQWTHHT